MPAFTGSEYARLFGASDTGANNPSWWPDLIGIVQDPTSASIKFALLEYCRAWVDIPIDFIQSIDLIDERECEGKLYNYVKISLNLPTTSEGKLFASLSQLDRQANRVAAVQPDVSCYVCHRLPHFGDMRDGIKSLRNVGAVTDRDSCKNLYDLGASKLQDLLIEAGVPGVLAAIIVQQSKDCWNCACADVF